MEVTNDDTLRASRPNGEVICRRKVHLRAVAAEAVVARKIKRWPLTCRRRQLDGALVLRIGRTTIISVRTIPGRESLLRNNAGTPDRKFGRTNSARWRSGYAGLCKSSQAGSIPALASILRSWLEGIGIRLLSGIRRRFESCRARHGSRSSVEEQARPKRKVISSNLIGIANTESWGNGLTQRPAKTPYRKVPSVQIGHSPPSNKCGLGILAVPCASNAVMRVRFPQSAPTNATFV